ncbi:unnamed protein product [Musa banksii]
MPEDINIYVTTPSNSVESSWGTYCPGMDPPPPPEFFICLGDLYSVAWMEDSDVHNLKEETIGKQYELVSVQVKMRTSEIGPFILRAVRSSGQALVDDWECLKSMVQLFESLHGSLTQSGMKHLGTFANTCNEGISMNVMEAACSDTCKNYNIAMWSPSRILCLILLSPQTLS